MVFNNKVKTGKLVIRKVPAAGEGKQLVGKTFTFTIRFGDVGGQSLGGIIPTQTRECTVTEHNGEYYGEIEIDKIPVGTRFVVSENPTPGTSLQKVTIEGIADGAVSDGMAYGTIAEGDKNAAKATFVNTTRKLIDITVKKVWQKQDNTEIPQADQPDAIHLQLQRTETPDKPESWQTVKIVELKKPTDYNGWTTQFTGLDKYDANKTGKDQVDYTYRVLESATGKDEDWHGDKDDDVIEIDGKKYKVLNPTAKGNKTDKTLTLTLTNQLQDAQYNLVITKQDAQDTTKKLGGVEFTLEKLEGEPSELPKTGKTDVDTGQLTFAGLTPGSYRLTETKTAEGYTLLADAIEFTLTTDGHCVRDAVKFGIVEYDSDTGMYNIALTINNRKSFELPHTGADAPSLWLLIGLPLAVAGLLILVFRYNKKGGRTR